MYNYKIIKVDHSMWTGKPKEKIEDIIEHYASRGWRLVQIAQDNGAMWYSGKIKTRVIFEMEASEEMYEPLYKESADNFV